MFSVTEIFVPHKEQQAEGEPRLLLSVLHKFYLFFSDKLIKIKPMIFYKIYSFKSKQIFHI